MKRTTTILLICAMVIGLFAVSRTNRELVATRMAYGITQADPLINAPPLVVFTTVALGGFRGIIADMLWMRSARLQYEGKYFELVQLADWITKLEPRFTDVWAYHAWNLTYNISVLFPDPADRWRWVRHGVSLLRDEGMMYNPGEPRLLYELGWFFQHKIGGSSDDAHMYYKQAWAAEMQALLGGGNPDYDLLLRDPVRLQMLQQQYKLDPYLMREIERAYGPLDWRLPQAHAIYWAMRSKEVGKETDVVFAERMIYQSMADAFRRGRLFFGSEGNRFIPSPNPSLLPYVMRAYENAMENPAERGTALLGYQFFLKESIVLLYLYNQIPDAQRIFNRLKQLQPEIPANTELQEFVFQAYTTRGTDMNMDEAYAAVESAFYQSVYWEAMGDADRARGFDQLARMTWNRYMAPRMASAELRERTGLPPPEEIRHQARMRVAETIGGQSLR